MKLLGYLAAAFLVGVIHCAMHTVSPGSGSETTGYVEFENGLKAPGARIEIRPAGQLAGVEGAGALQTTIANDSGAFRFDAVLPNSYTVIATYGDSLGAMQHFSVVTRSSLGDIRLTLKRNSAIVGKVLGAFDASIGKLIVGASGIGRSVRIDSAGNFRIDALPAGNHRLAVMRSSNAQPVAGLFSAELPPDTVLDVAGIPILSYWFLETQSSDSGGEEPLRALSGDTLRIFESSFPICMNTRLLVEASSTIRATVNGQPAVLRERESLPIAVQLYEMGCGVIRECDSNRVPAGSTNATYTSRAIEITLGHDVIDSANRARIQLVVENGSTQKFEYQWTIEQERIAEVKYPSYGYQLLRVEWLQGTHKPTLTKDGTYFYVRVLGSKSIAQDKLPLLFGSTNGKTYGPMPDTIAVFCSGPTLPLTTTYIGLEPDSVFGNRAIGIDSTLFTRIDWFNEIDPTALRPTSQSQPRGYYRLANESEFLRYRRERGCPWDCLCFSQDYRIDQFANAQRRDSALLTYLQVTDGSRLCTFSAPRTFDRYSIRIMPDGEMLVSTITSGEGLLGGFLDGEPLFLTKLSHDEVEALRGIFTDHAWSDLPDLDTADLGGTSSISSLWYDGREYILSDRSNPSTGMQSVFDSVKSWCDSYVKARFLAQDFALIDTLYNSLRSISVAGLGIEMKDGPCFSSEDRESIQLTVTANGVIPTTLQLDYFWLLHPTPSLWGIRFHGMLKQSTIDGSKLSATCENVVSETNLRLSQYQGMFSTFVCRMRDAANNVYYLRWTYDREFSGSNCR